MDIKYTVEPLDFLFTNDLFKGFLDIKEDNIDFIKKREDAYVYAFEQNLPSGYKVWKDFIENYRIELRKNKKFQEAYCFVNNFIENLQANNSSLIIDYRKKKIKKTNTLHDDFCFSEAREDAFFVLSTVAINRYLDNFSSCDFLERVFAFYKAGAWPCGMKGNNILLFNPSYLK